MYERIREAAEASGLPAVTCSEPYSKRIEREIGLPASKLKAIAPGVPITNPMERSQALELVRQQFPEFDPDLPLISFLGRRDSEKGIDLLLYAAQILRQRGMTFQLAVCGPTAFGSRYSVACRQIAQILKLPVLSSEYVPGDLRSALFRVSRCVVYPSIHEEPFGMVPVEAMVQGTPVVVSDAGGVAELPFLGKQQAGLVFRSWDSGDLAEQLERILSESAMHRRFAMAAPQIGAHYSVERMADRFLDHLSLPRSLHQQEEIRLTRNRAA